MLSSGIVDYTVVGSEAATRSLCLHEGLQQEYPVLVVLEVERSWPQTQLAKVSRGKSRGETEYYRYHYY